MSDGFLGRWSRRKRGLEQEPPEAAPAPAPAAPEAAPPAEPEFDPASLPPLESLDQGGDLTPFLHPKVPALLRQAALRRAWSADPGIRDFVGPADYAWDYNAPNGVPGFSLELGDVNLKKLLAQFTGQPQEPEDDAPGTATEEPEVPEQEEAPQPLLAAAPPLPESAVRLSTETPQLPAEVPAATEPVEADAPEPSPPPRRRHGGALPRLG
jgi:hypothetical protein